ncbi:unnamed protein product [Choristocarpus tenellus]
MSILEEVEILCTSLRSNGATARRKAIKDILELIEKESNRASLATIPAGKSSMWVRLIKNAKLAVDMEVATSYKKNRKPRKEESEFLWKLVRLADERYRQLTPVVSELLGHVVNVLVDDVAREVYAQDYTQILCRVLEESIPPFCTISRGADKNNSRKDSCVLLETMTFSPTHIVSVTSEQHVQQPQKKRTILLYWTSRPALRKVLQ